MSRPVLIAFSAGAAGEWIVDAVRPVIGKSLPTAARLRVVEHPGHGAASDTAPDAAWSLRGVTSNQRYSTRGEVGALRARQAGLGRPEATRAALIPISKSAAWWALAQDERREIMEETSRHIAIGLAYLPAIARRLHHGRDLGEEFDFLTWFDYAPADSGAFEELVGRLRASEEWRYVVREVDIRLSRA